MSVKADTCPCCLSVTMKETFSVREMMLGLKEHFQYSQCQECGTLRRQTAVPDLTKYYPEKSYYSYQGQFPPPAPFRLFYTQFKSWLYLHTPYVLRSNKVPTELKWLSACSASLGDKILDVGCGDGHFLFALYKLGFRHLFGIDPYLQEGRECPPGVQVKPDSIFDVSDKYDRLFFHHSLEHMQDPYTVLSNAYELLKSNGTVLIRTPCVDSQAWETYGVHWAQIDAPRHEQVFSLRGLTLLAERTGFSIEHVEYDSTEFQFWASEQYKRDIALYDTCSHFVASQDALFSSEELDEFRQRARELNDSGKGDQLCLYLRKRSD